MDKNRYLHVTVYLLTWDTYLTYLTTF